MSTIWVGDAQNWAYLPGNKEIISQLFQEKHTQWTYSMNSASKCSRPNVDWVDGRD